MRFNPNEYETVAEREARFRRDFPNGRVYTFMLSDAAQANTFVVMGAILHSDINNMPTDATVLQQIATASTGITTQNASAVMATIAMILKADSFGHSISMAGGKGADQSAWIENCETSAIGRALSNFRYSGDKKATREEMQKAQHVNNVQQDQNALRTNINGLLTSLANLGYPSQDMYQLCVQQIGHDFDLATAGYQELSNIQGVLQGQLGQLSQRQQAFA